MPVNLRLERRKRAKTLRAMADEITAATAELVPGSRITKRVLQSAETGRRPKPENQLALATFFGFDHIEQWPEPALEEAAA